jgi:excisionase family DNA binding protein
MSTAVVDPLRLTLPEGDERSLVPETEKDGQTHYEFSGALSDKPVSDALQDSKEMSLEEAAESLMVSRQFLTGLLDRGEIPCSRTGRGIRIRLDALETYGGNLRRKQDTFLAEMDAAIED